MPREMRDPTTRFSDRVEHYARHRPGYPRELPDLLVREGALVAGDVVADIGSGTGKLAEVFLRHGHRVLGVEPNREMREAGERCLARWPGFTSVGGRAEATGLGDGSVDVVSAGQAFHWFDPEACRRESARILRPGGRAILVWNDRQTRATPLMKGYEALLRSFGTDYEVVRRKGADGRDVAAFFGSGGWREAVLPHHQDLDLGGFLGRLLSSSYVPAPGQAGHEAMVREAEDLFEEHARGGIVRFVYTTKVFHGPVAPPG